MHYDKILSPESEKNCLFTLSFQLHISLEGLLLWIEAVATSPTHIQRDPGLIPKPTNSIRIKVPAKYQLVHYDFSENGTNWTE